MKWPWSDSIAQRILWGYYVLVAMVVVTMLLMWTSLAQIRSKIYVLEATSEMTDTVLEIRRYEKNWLLYRGASEFAANEDLIEVARELLQQNWQQFASVASPRVVEEVQATLADYRDLMRREFEIFETGQEHRLVAEIREKGKDLVDLASLLDSRIRKSIDRTLAIVIVSGVFFVAIVALLATILGQKMATSVVKPLHQIVHCTRKIAQGDFSSCEYIERGVEIEAVVQAMHRMLAQLELREKQIIQSEKLAAVGTLVAGVAHELNNPLSNVGSSAQILLEELQEGNGDREFQKSMVVQIVDQTERARRIVRSLLEFSRQKEVHPAKLRLGDIFAETYRLIKGEIPTRVNFQVIVKKDGQFWADKQRLEQGLVNLLLNAFHAVGGGGEVLLKGWVLPEEGHARLQVIDNGPGIPPELQEKVFDPFFTTKDVGEGSGLGLAVTREIIDKHGGSISMESRPGEGTTFTITLPLEISGALES